MAATCYPLGFGAQIGSRNRGAPLLCAAKYFWLTVTLALTSCKSDADRKEGTEDPNEEIAATLPDPVDTPIQGVFAGQDFRQVYGVVSASETQGQLSFHFVSKAPHDFASDGHPFDKDKFCMPYPSDEQDYTAILAGAPNAPGTYLSKGDVIYPESYINMAVTDAASGPKSQIAEASLIQIDQFDGESAQLTGKMVAKAGDLYTLNGRFWAHRCDLPSKPTEFQGHWVNDWPSDDAADSSAECFEHITHDLMFSDRTLYVSTNLFRGAPCYEKVYYAMSVFDASFGTTSESGTELNLLLEHASVTPTDSPNAADFNAQKFCGISDWAPRITRDVTGRDCLIGLYPVKTQGDRVFDVVKRDGSSIFIGKRTSTQDGLSEGARPSSIDTAKGFRFED